MAGHKKKATTKQKRKRKLILFIIEIIVLIILLVGVFYASKLNKINRQQLDESKVEKAEVSKETEETLSGYTDIALFGLDNRSNGTYDTGNSDVIMVLSINNDTKEVRMVSIYRDTYLDVSSKDEKSNFQKCNSAYARGGAERAVSMLNKNLDLNIDNYVVFDFAAIADAIDLLGGIELDITEAEMKIMNESYITYTEDIVGKESSFIDHAGTQTVDGVQAVSYARIRYTAGGDFKRAERQRTVISKTFEKAKKANISKITQIMDTVFPEIKTDLSSTEMMKIVRIAMGYDISQSVGFPFDRTTDTLGKKGSCVIPCDLESNVIKLHQLLYNDTEYTPSEKVQSYSDYIIDSTGFTQKSAERDEFSLPETDTGTDGTDGSAGDATDSGTEQ